MSERRRFNNQERVALYLAVGGKCGECGTELEQGWHADHVDPHSRGGKTDVANGQALCPTCNLKKGNRLLRSAGKVGRGRRTDLESPGADSAPSLHGEPENSQRTAERLAADAPEQYEAVKSGELSLNAAAVQAGIRRRRVSIRTDDPRSIAGTIRRHVDSSVITELVKLLEGE